MDQNFFLWQTQDSLAQTCFAIIFFFHEINSESGGDDRKSLSFNHDQQIDETPRKKIKNDLGMFQNDILRHSLLMYALHDKKK